MEESIAERHWITRAKEEAFENMNRKHQHGTGICTVFILDTSESMKGEGFRQMKEAFYKIINEYKELRLDDNVAVIGFGDEVKFLHYYSNDYDSIKKCLDHVECKGPSPMEAGILLSLSCISLGGGHNAIFQSLVIRARVVVISDGNPTDMSSPLEKCETSQESDAFIRLLYLVEARGRSNPFTFIPVGTKPNYRLLGTLAIATRGGRLLSLDEARQCARFSLYVLRADCLISKYPEKCLTESIVRRSKFTNATPSSRSYIYHSEEDDSYICEIINEKEVYSKLCDDNEKDNDDLYIERCPTMPSVGTRVKRGPDWQWDDQDSHGVGTITGHSTREGWLHVEWDTGKSFNYRYGYDGTVEAYDVLVCDEPRFSENQKIAVGCLVKQGPDWQWGDQNGSEESIGTVYRLQKSGVVYVRWPNGNKSNYRFGHKNKYDLILCDPKDSKIVMAWRVQKE